MKPGISASPPLPLIFVGDDDDDEVGANDAEEEDSIDRTIARSVGRHKSTQHKKGQRSNGVGLRFGFGFGLEWETELENMQIRAWTPVRPPHPIVHPRTASRSPNIAQNMASSNANAAGSRMNAQRLLGHCRVLSIDRAAAARAPQRAKPRSFTTTTIPTTPASASATMGFRDPLVVRREENEARTEAEPPRFSCLLFCCFACWGFFS
jgi:hypothetical protein